MSSCTDGRVFSEQKSMTQNEKLQALTAEASSWKDMVCSQKASFERELARMNFIIRRMRESGARGERVLVDHPLQLVRVCVSPWQSCNPDVSEAEIADEMARIDQPSPSALESDSKRWWCCLCVCHYCPCQTAYRLTMRLLSFRLAWKHV